MIRSFAIAFMAILVLSLPAFASSEECDMNGHMWSDGYCSVCGDSCEHSWTEGVCAICGMTCTHEWMDGTCQFCGMICTHNWMDAVCTYCGAPDPAYSTECSHDWIDGTCQLCGMPCTHDWSPSGYCCICDAPCCHDIVDGVCRICGYVDSVFPSLCEHLANEVFDGVCYIDTNSMHHYVCSLCGFELDLGEHPVGADVACEICQELSLVGIPIVDEANPSSGFSLSALLSSISAVFSSILSWVNAVVDVIVHQPLLLLGCIVGFVGLGVGLFKRLTRL